jgi:hypothetical protein
MTTKKSKPQGGAAEARRDLAQKIAAVMNHPALPADLRQGFYHALNGFENTIDLTRLCYSEQALAHAFELRAEDEAKRKGGA